MKVHVILSLNELFWKHLSPLSLPRESVLLNGVWSVTLVRLRKGILPLQKLLHFMVTVGKTPACSKKKKSESPV